MVARSLLAWTCAVAAAGCGRKAAGPRGLLDAVPVETTAVVQLDPAAVRATWVEAVAVALASRAQVPACVVARARTAERVVIAWAEMLPDDGVLVAMTGGDDAPCPALAIRGAIASWGRDLAPRPDGDPGYFADRDRRARMTRLARAPVRGLADYQLSAGIVARTDVTIDGRDGVAAVATVRFDDASAADGARARLERWRNTVDADRLGGAWAAVQALGVRGPEPGTPSLELTLRLAGPTGADAASLLAAAVIAGTYRDERTPCPADTAMTPWAVTCAGGEVRVPLAGRDRMLAAGALGAAFEQRTTAAGAPSMVVRGLAPSSPLRALGLASGDAVLEIDGASATPAALAAVPARARALALDTTATVRIARGGRRLTLRYRLVP